MTKLAWAGCAVIAAAAWCWNAAAQQPYDADPAAVIGPRELVTHFQERTNGPTVVTVVEPRARVLAVYHLDPSSGAIKLKSVRNIEWDLRLTDFNSDSPTPDEIRQGFDRQP